MHLRYRQTCRVCGSTELTPVLDLGEQHLQGSFIKEGRDDPPMRKIPLEVVRCDVERDEQGCGLVQLRHTTPTEILYSSYWYRSGTNNTMRNHLREIAEEAADLVGRPSARALDIGCNDGTLLSCYPTTYSRYGIDPSDVAQTVKDDALEIIQALFPSPALASVAGAEPFDIITSIAMFYDLENPTEFVRHVKANLAHDGVWVFEMSYMPSMLRQNSYDTICHEHLEYYSLAVIEHVLRREKMRVFRASLNSINGGSIRCYATHEDNFKFSSDGESSLDRLRLSEFDLCLDTDKPYRAFSERIATHREELRKLVRELKNDGKRIHVYGASTKGNVILQYCGLDSSVIDCASDRNPEKYGARTIGTDIPIVSEEKSRELRPDYYLVLPWHFREEFVERESDMLSLGGAMIFPLPEIEIVRSEGVVG